MTKFVTNSLEAYSSLEKGVTFAEPFSEMEITTLLGNQKDLKTDNLCVCRDVLSLLPGKIPQRKNLSVVSSVFDPLGFVSPFTITGRLILKELKNLGSWSANLGTSLSLLKISAGSRIGVPICRLSQRSKDSLQF